MPIIVQQDATMYSFLYFCKLLYMFRVVTPPIIRSTYNCNYSIWRWSNFGKCSVWSQLKMRGMDFTVSAIFRDCTIAEDSRDGSIPLLNSFMWLFDQLCHQSEVKLVTGRYYGFRQDCTNPGRLHCVSWRLTFMLLQCGTGFMSATVAICRAATPVTPAASLCAHPLNRTSPELIQV
jgi:hypothetical protein